MFDCFRQYNNVSTIVWNWKWFLQVNSVAAHRTKLILLGEEIIKLNPGAGIVEKVRNVTAACRQVDHLLAFQVIARSVLLKKPDCVVAGMRNIHYGCTRKPSYRLRRLHR